LLGKFLVRLAAFLFIAGIVSSFRYAYDRAHFLALRDRMTGALNAQSFREQAHATIAASRAAGRTMLLVMLDLDDFKAVNSDHGHAAGDAVLRAFAKATASVIRREDDFGRLGGDEFAVLAALPSGDEAKAFATALHCRVTTVLANGPHPVTCSMGALIVPPDNQAAEADLMEQADMLMYAAKNSGKNALRTDWCSNELPAPSIKPAAELRPACTREAYE